MYRFVNAVAIAVAIGLATPAYAETWYLVVVSRGKLSGDSEYSLAIPMLSEEQCNAAGNKLETSAVHGKFRRNRDYLLFECILGK